MKDIPAQGACVVEGVGAQGLGKKLESRGTSKHGFTVWGVRG